jgi:parvulin-like peptidyl-prolyl isomerase
MKLSKVGFLLSITLLCASQALAQSEERPIDEVIARVNAGVIMRSAFEDAQKSLLEDLKKQGLKDAELEKKFNEQKAMVLDYLINSQLLAQRAKDLSINVEPQVNRELLRLMKENNCESKECLGQKMREAGYDIEEVSRTLTENFSREAVMGQEVYGKVFRQLTEKEKREAYEKNKQFFTEPGEVALSRIFIATGKDANQSLQRAQAIAAQAKVAADFAALAKSNSEEALGKEGGKLASIKISDLAPEVKTVIENAPVGTITDPIKLETGYYVFRVDERKEPKTLPFEDEKVVDAVGRYLVGQKSEKQIEEYLAKLRDEAFIEIDPRYQFEGSKVKSVSIKRTPYSEENAKERKKREKEEKKKAEEAAKAATTQKAASNKP